MLSRQFPKVGRAGRDGKLATCLTLVSAADLPLLRSMIYGGTPSPAAVLGLLRTVFGGQEDECDFNFYDLSQVCNLRTHGCVEVLTVSSHLRFMHQRGDRWSVTLRCMCPCENSSYKEVL